MASDSLNDLEAFALELNDAAARAALPFFRAEHGMVDKGPAGAFDPVTRADRDAEAAMRRLIEARYPRHGVIGEEYGHDRADAEWVWVLDPVDGTRAFVAGLPLWTTLIGLRREGRPVVGSIGQPFLDEVYVGTAAGSRLVSRGAETRLAVRPCPALAQAVIATTDPELFKEEERPAWDRVRRASRLARLGCDAYAYAMVAAGSMDLVVEAGLKAWDIDAAIPLLEGAGGQVCDWRGAPVGSEGGQVALAGDPAVLEAALQLLGAAAA